MTSEADSNQKPGLTLRRNSYVSPSSISSVLSSASSPNDEDNQIELLAKLIGPNDDYELNVKGRNLGPHGGYVTAQWLKKNKNVKQVNLSENYLQDEGIIYFAIGIRTHTCLTHLNISKNSITESGMRVLLDNLTYFGLILLDISGNPFGNNVDCLVRLLELNKTLKELYINSIDLEDDGAKKLGVSLSLNKTIEKLEIGWNHIRMNGAAVFSRGLASNTKIKEINLKYNGFSLEGTIPFAECLKLNKTLVKIDLSCNRMSLECASTLSNALHQNSTLEFLNLSNNPLTSSGVHQILYSINNDVNKIEYLGLKNVPIVKVDLLLIELIQKRRKFTCEYGNVIISPNNIGLNIPVEEQPIMKLAKYLSEKRLRIIDMFRIIDSKQILTMERIEFVKRLKIFEPRLRIKEIISIADGISKNDLIDYSHLYKQVYQARNEVLLQENLLVKQKLRTLKRNRIYMYNLQRQFKALLDEHSDTLEPVIDKWLNESTEEYEKNGLNNQRISITNRRKQPVFKIENSGDFINIPLNDFKLNPFKYQRLNTNPANNLNSVSLQDINENKKKISFNTINESLIKIDKQPENNKIKTLNKKSMQKLVPIQQEKEINIRSKSISQTIQPKKILRENFLKKKTNEIIKNQISRSLPSRNPNERTKVKFKEVDDLPSF